MIDINELEKEFNKLQNDNFNQSFIMLNGKHNDLFLSAPHAVEQTRDNKIKFAEKETALICLYLNKNYDIPCIIKLHNQNDDANFDLPSTYKNEVIKNIKLLNPLLFIDLHQLAPSREQSICLGTGNEANSNLCNFHFLATQIKDCFKFENTTINNPFKASGLGTNAKYVSEICNVPSVQIEINSKLICAPSDDRQANFEKVIQSILSIKKLVKEEKNENIACK